MASIAISDLHPAGYNLLFDGESFMTDLNENELDRVSGGTPPLAIVAIGFGVVVGAGLIGYGVGQLIKACQ
jgi:lactobin A/cerein 7B family class IIb bacteriocin